MPVSGPDVSRLRLIRDARFLEVDRREIALRRGRHNRLGFSYQVAFASFGMAFPPTQSSFQVSSESEQQGYTDHMSQGRHHSLVTATMKPITCLLAFTAALVIATPVYAQVDCTDWNTAAFFDVAEVSDVTRCLQAGANLEARNGHGQTPLHRVVSSGTGEAVTALLEVGADLNAQDAPLSGFTPLHYAAQLRTTIEYVTALLAAGADPNARDSDGTLPFDYARDNEQLKGTDAYWKLNDARFSIAVADRRLKWNGG